jgi:hypothetical protein
MDRFRPLLICILLLLSAPARAAGEPGSALDHPNRFAFELLGRGFIGSFAYERQLSQRFSGGLGLGFFPGQLGDSNDALMVPVYVNYDFTDDQRGVYAFGGVDVMLVYPYGGGNGNFVNFVNERVMPIWGGGYEYLSDSGFLFRVGLSFFFIIPWPGLTLGFSF